MTFNSALLELAEAELITAHICPLCGTVLSEAGVTLIRVNGVAQKIVATDKIGALLIKGTAKWMYEVPVVCVAKRDHPAKEPLTEPSGTIP